MKKKKEKKKRCSIEKGVFKNFAILTGKHSSCLELVFDKVAGLQVYYKETPTQVFSVNIAEFLRTLILKNICERLALHFIEVLILGKRLSGPHSHGFLA